MRIFHRPAHAAPDHVAPDEVVPPGDGRHDGPQQQQRHGRALHGDMGYNPYVRVQEQADTWHTACVPRRPGCRLLCAATPRRHPVLASTSRLSAVHTHNDVVRHYPCGMHASQEPQ